MQDLRFGKPTELFLEQSGVFLDKALETFGASNLFSLQPIITRNSIPIPPVVIEDYHNIHSDKLQKLRESYFSEQGVAYFIVLNPETPTNFKHPLFEIANQLVDDLELYYPIIHPLEGHPEAVTRFGQSDGTVKIYDLVKKQDGYREQAETSEMFSLHTDGLGSGGTVATTALYMDAPQIVGGYTFFLNIIRLALELARTDMEAFRALFLPDALTHFRPRGKGAIKVKSPVIFLNEKNNPQSFFRTSSGEYIVEWRRDIPALDRAMNFLNYYSQPFAPTSFFIHLTAKGHGCFIRNQVMAHGRTSFTDGPAENQKRVLSRKWYMISERDTVYKHVPGMFISKGYGDLFPDLFGAEFLQGEWQYNAELEKNIKLK